MSTGLGKVCCYRWLGQAHQIPHCRAAVDCDMVGWDSMVYGKRQVVLNNLGVNVRWSR